MMKGRVYREHACAQFNGKPSSESVLGGSAHTPGGQNSFERPEPKGSPESLENACRGPRTLAVWVSRPKKKKKKKKKKQNFKE